MPLPCRQAFALRTTRVESRRIAGLDHFWFLFFKPVFVYWPGGGATPTNKTESWSSNPVMHRGVAFVVRNANVWCDVSIWYAYCSESENRTIKWGASSLMTRFHRTIQTGAHSYTLKMFYKGQSIRDARQNFEKNKGQSLAFPIVQVTKILWHGKGHRQFSLKDKWYGQKFVKDKGHLC